MSRAGDAVWDSDAVLHRTAELTIGYSGAELANLLNEAAILMARPPAQTPSVAAAAGMSPSRDCFGRCRSHVAHFCQTIIAALLY